MEEEVVEVMVMVMEASWEAEGWAGGPGAAGRGPGWQWVLLWVGACLESRLRTSPRVRSGQKQEA